jgi:hypothetical protein
MSAAHSTSLYTNIPLCQVIARHHPLTSNITICQVITHQHPLTSNNSYARCQWMPVKNCRTIYIPLCGNFSNHISRTFLIHSSHWFKYIFMCVYLKKKLIKLLSSFFGMDFDMCPLLESDMIIPLYTSFNLNK